ncbi:predicted protein [Chaetoceros tenuissimus]|uniref:Uncharacterized protein n=1 Tax=Chaetoceros tenuissimus TaxID=426638 RepID=A0AAD3H6M6_9STRA|nr:predicted protein [Chaetoceros tenuissimus]
MIDIESGGVESNDQTEESLTMSSSSNLRRRPQAQHIKDDEAIATKNKNQDFVKQYKQSLIEEDDDKIFKDAIMKQHKEMNKQQMGNQMTMILFLVGFVALLYIYASNASEDPSSNKSGLAKALGILLGINKRTKVMLPAGSRIISTTSIQKSDLDQFLYPSWPWRSNDSKFLIPGNEKGRQIQKILHRRSILKKDRNINVEIFDETDVLSFLSSETGQRCNNTQVSIVDHYKSFQMEETKNMVFAWCMLFTKEAFGFLDLDHFEVHLQASLIHGITTGKIKNFILDSRNMQVSDGSDDTKLVTSIIFPGPSSNIARDMLKYFMTSDNSNEEQLLTDSVDVMNEIIDREKDQWTLPRTNCVNLRHGITMADICGSDYCCEVMYSRK